MLRNPDPATPKFFAMNIKVIGAGISGLSTAIILQEAGHQIEIIAAEMPLDTVSAVAAAIWLPFNMGPQELVNQWALESYAIFQKMSDDPQTGVSMVQLEVWVEQQQPPWAKALPSNILLPTKDKASPAGIGHGFSLQVPLIESPIYLPYLFHRYKAGGGKITLKKVHNLSTIAKKADYIINCTALGARDLCNDQELFHIRGQLIKVKADFPNPMIVDFPLPETQDQLLYMIPRQDGLLLGGSASLGDERKEVVPAESKAIWQRALAYAPKLEGASFLGDYVGLRPGRSEVRLEKEGNIIHNYGHGGGGYTVSWGCAKAVLQLL
jgi:D-amino-acid oxidase